MSVGRRNLGHVTEGTLGSEGVAAIFSGGRADLVRCCG